MPESLARKYPNAPREWCWQFYLHVMERPGAGGPSPLDIS